jgi:hypothetical protein
MTNPTIPAGRTVRFLLLLAAAALGPAASASGQGWFAYTDQYRVVTLEFKGENLAILNVINLGDTAFVVEPSAVLMVKTGGQVIPGQVFASKDTSGATIYRASLLVPARSSGGTDLLGAFQLRQDALKVYMLLAGRYLELAGQRRDQFESLLGRLGELNLNEPDKERMFRNLGIPATGLAPAGAPVDPRRPGRPLQRFADGDDSSRQGRQHRRGELLAGARLRHGGSHPGDHPEFLAVPSCHLQRGSGGHGDQGEPADRRTRWDWKN